MSIDLLSATWRCGPSDRSQRLLLLAIADNANDQGICWPSTQTLAAKTCMDVRTVLRALKALEQQAWLRIIRKSHEHKGNTYELNLTKLAVTVSRDSVSCDKLSRDKTCMSQVTNCTKSGDKTCNPPHPPLGRTVKNHQEPPTPSAFVLPEWIPKPQWDAYLEMRKSVRAKMTDHAMHLAVKALVKLRSQGHEPGEVLDQSTMNSWKGLFALNQLKSPIATRQARKIHPVNGATL